MTGFVVNEASGTVAQRLWRRVALLGNAGLVPVDDVDEFPGIFVELEFELAFFVDDQLGSGIENAGALTFVLIIEIELAGGQVVGGGWGVGINFTEAKHAIADEPNLETRVGGDQTNVAEVVTESAGDGDAADGPHLGESIDQ